MSKNFAKNEILNNNFCLKNKILWIFWNSFNAFIDFGVLELNPQLQVLTQCPKINENIDEGFNDTHIKL